MKTSVLGIVFGDSSAEKLGGLTANRTTASLPVCGRYRMIDFVLSNMVHAGVGRIGVLSKHHYRSLMDHLKSGKQWDLSRRHGGLFILPPFAGKGRGVYNSNIEALFGITDFIENGDEELVVISESDILSNFDLSAAINEHIAEGNGISAVYAKLTVPGERRGFEVLNKGLVTPVMIKPGETGNVPVAYIYKKRLLLNILKDAADYGFEDFESDMVVDQRLHAKVGAVEVSGICFIIDSVKSYYDVNMAMLNTEVREEAFLKNRPVFTSESTHMPAKVMDGEVRNSLVSAGCEIDGYVENSILFRGVKVQRDAVVKDSILFHDTVVDKNATVTNVVTDKNVFIRNDHSINGSEESPLFVAPDSQL